jgi:hypothetical protein
VFVSLFNILNKNIVDQIRAALGDRKSAMVLFSLLRKLVGLTLTMLVIITSVQPVHARFAYGDTSGGCGISNPAMVDAYRTFDTVLYISEEAGEQLGCKSRAHRLGSVDPLSMATGASATCFGSGASGVLPYSAVHAGEFFRSPHKTGPPVI